MKRVCMVISVVAFISILFIAELVVKNRQLVAVTAPESTAYNGLIQGLVEVQRYLKEADTAQGNATKQTADVFQADMSIQRCVGIIVGLSSQSINQHIDFSSLEQVLFTADVPLPQDPSFNKRLLRSTNAINLVVSKLGSTTLVQNGDTYKIKKALDELDQLLSLPQNHQYLG